MQEEMSNNPKFILHMSNEDLKERLFLVKNRLNIRTKKQLAEKLGCSRPMLHLYETGQNEPPTEFFNRLEALERDAGIRQIINDYTNDANQTSNENVLNDEEELPYLGGYQGRECHIVQVLGQAHAGDPTYYEQTPEHWRETVATDCKDKGAFGCKVVGNSMAPYFQEDDILILMPNAEPWNGGAAVGKFTNGDVVIRNFELRGDDVTLVPVNTQYPVEHLKREEFEWIYPVYESRRLVRK